MRHAAAAAALVLVWTAMSSLLFVLLGQLTAVYPMPSSLWQWWHYAIWGRDLPGVPWLLAESAALPTLMLVAGGVRAAMRAMRPRQPALFGQTDWATQDQAERAGFTFRGKLGG